MPRLLFLLLLALLPSVARGQAGIPPDSLAPGAGFVWEAVGDRGVSAKALQFTPDGALWSAGNRRFRLDPATQTWAQLSTAIRDAIVVFPAGATEDDTLFVSNTNGVYRSFDRGESFTEVQDPGGEALALGPTGMLLVGGFDAPFVHRSLDRGATWAPAAFDPPGGAALTHTFLALPPSPERPGGVALAGTWYGVAVSEDGGRTFRPSSLWSALDYAVHEMAAVEGPGGGRRVLAGGFRNAQPYGRAWRSADDGATWGGETAFRDIDDGGSRFQSVQGLVSLGGPSALLILGRGAVYRTDDGGGSWMVVGRTPMPDPTMEYVGTALVGPDGRLYVGLTRIGASTVNGGRVFRTSEPVVSAEPSPMPEGSGLMLRVEPNPSSGAVALVLTLGAAEARVRVVVYDSLGREVAVAHEGALAAGEHRLPLNTRGLAPGAYVARVTAGDRTATVRLALTR